MDNLPDDFEATLATEFWSYGFKPDLESISEILQRSVQMLLEEGLLVGRCDVEADLFLPNRLA
jgi:hypothetical protein